jgi:hypothetical protein
VGEFRRPRGRGEGSKGMWRFKVGGRKDGDIPGILGRERGEREGGGGLGGKEEMKTGAVSGSPCGSTTLLDSSLSRV